MEKYPMRQATFLGTCLESFGKYVPLSCLLLVFFDALDLIAMAVERVAEVRQMCFADSNRNVFNRKRYRVTLKSLSRISQRVVLNFKQQSGRANSIGLCDSATIRETR